MEFGVYRGRSINFMADLLPDATLYGFDSFEGFPDDGRGDWDQDFSVEGLPKVADNVSLIKGFFDETLPAFLSQNPDLSPPRLLHIDCDIYSSTKVVFDQLGHLLTASSVIVFDELLHYRGFRENEFLAFYEFLETRGLTFRWLARNGKCMPLERFLKQHKDCTLPSMQDLRKAGYHQNVAVMLEVRPDDYEGRLALYRDEADRFAKTYPLVVG